MVRQWHASGLNIRDFCFRHSLSEPSFYSWRRELARRDQQAVHRTRRRPQFVPLRTIADNPEPRSNGSIEIVLAGGRLVRVGSQVDAQTLTTVVQVLEANRC
jgi:hypothetical protein